MEHELRNLADALQGRLEGAISVRSDAIAASVYRKRRHGLVRHIAILPTVLGILALTGIMGIGVSTPPQDWRRQMTVLPQHPQNAEVIWQKTITPPIGARFQLSLDLSHSLKAVEVKTHKVLWRQTLPTIASTAVPVVFNNAQGRVFVSVATEIGAVYLIAASNGFIQWMQNVSTAIQVSPLVVQNSIVTVACADGKIYGLNAGDGSIDYMIQTGAAITSLEPVSDDVGRFVYAVQKKNRLLAIDAHTGDLRWVRDTFGSVSDSPLVSGKRVIAATQNGDSAQLWAFDREGNLRWMNTFDHYNALASGEGYIAMAQGNLVTLLSAETGEALHYWQLAKVPAVLSVGDAAGFLTVRTDQGTLVSGPN